MCYCKVLETSAPHLSLRQDRTDTYTGGSAPNLRLLHTHGTCYVWIDFRGVEDEDAGASTTSTALVVIATRLWVDKTLGGRL